MMSSVPKIATKGELKSLEIDAHNLEFDFNPTTIEERRSVQYNFSESQGQVLPLAQFGRVGNTEISFELFFFDPKGVGKQLRSIRMLTMPRELSRNTYYDQVQPHRYVLSLSSYGVFTGVVTSVDIKTMQYSKNNLTPIHFTAKLNFVVTSVNRASDVSLLQQFHIGG